MLCQTEYFGHGGVCVTVPDNRGTRLIYIHSILFLLYSNKYLQMTSAFVMVGAYQEDEVRTYLTNLGFEKIETYWLTSIQSKSMERLICTPYKNGCQSNNQQPFYYATNLNCRIGGNLLPCTRN